MISPTMARNSEFCTGWLLAMTAVLSFWIVPAGAQTPATTGGLDTSAEYIVGFVRHVRWKAEDQLPAWQVCVMGDLPRDQEQAYVGRTVRGKGFEVSHVEADAALDDCQVLDLTAADGELAEQVLTRIRSMPILAVGSGADFCSAGGQICLHIAAQNPQPRRKFEVNLSTIKESTLEVSARLLTVGMVRAASEDQR